MKTKWGSCNHRAGHIRLNTELVKKPKDLLEYVVVHEMVHLLEPTPSERFIALLQENYPSWREARAELNDLPQVPKHGRSSPANLHTNPAGEARAQARYRPIITPRSWFRLRRFGED